VVFVAPSFVYLIAGELSPRVPVDDQGAVWRLDLAQDAASAKWERVPTSGAAPPPSIAPTVVAVGTRLYLFGGRTAVDMQQGVLGDVYRLDTTTHTWSLAWSRAAASSGGGGAAADCPAPRSYHAAASLGGKFFVFGGCGPSGRLNDLWAFDPQAASWERMPDPPRASVPPRGGAALAALPAQKRLVVVGGFDGDKERSDAHSFDVDARAWCLDSGGGCASCAGEAPTLPARSVLGVAEHTGCAQSEGGAAAGAGCSHSSHVVAFGGECDPSATRSHDAAGRFLSDAWCGDGQKGAWHPLKTAGDGGPGPRGWFASCAVPGGMLLHGGLDASNARLSDCWRLHLGH
jgi:hypothetical protein